MSIFALRVVSLNPLYRFLLTLIILLHTSALAETVCSSKENCIDKQSWQIGVALGLGVKTNPLVDGRDIPLVIIPDVAWYGDQAYFDNGELGLQWINDSQYSVETFILIDKERAFFSFLHPANIFSPENSISADFPAEEPFEDFKQPLNNLSIDEIARRKWAIHAGARWHYFFDNSELTASVEHDISRVHDGQKVNIGYRYAGVWQDVNFSFSILASWKSARLVDYYYGVSEQDTDNSSLYFMGESGWQPKISFSVSKPINKKWHWLGSASYQYLPNSFTNSPLVDNNNIKRIFLGVAYRF